MGLQPYENLTNCTAAPYAAYLLSKGSHTDEELADAIDLARFSEDQFTFWDTPVTADGIKEKATPCVYEQYKYQKPVDASACNVTGALLSLYEATGDAVYLAKGKALVDNITVVQNVVNGQIPTTWDFRERSGSTAPTVRPSRCCNWPTCSIRAPDSTGPTRTQKTMYDNPRHVHPPMPETHRTSFGALPCSSPDIS